MRQNNKKNELLAAGIDADSPEMRQLKREFDLKMQAIKRGVDILQRESIFLVQKKSRDFI